MRARSGMSVRLGMSVRFGFSQPPSRRISAVLLPVMVLLLAAAPLHSDGAQPKMRRQKSLAAMAQPTLLAWAYVRPAQLLVIPGGWLVREASGRLSTIAASLKYSSFAAPLPVGAKLLSPAWAWTATAVLRYEPAKSSGGGPAKGAWQAAHSGKQKIIAALLHDGAIWWLEGADGGNLRRLRTAPGSKVETLAKNVGPALGLFAAEGGVDIAVGGPEPRGLKRYRPNSGVTWLMKSRFFTRAISHRSGLTGPLWALNTTSGGWLERIENGKWARRAFVPAGSRDLVRIGAVMYWRSPGAIFRYDPKKGRPEAIAMNTAAASLVVDGNSLLWLDTHRGQLVRLAAP